MVARHHKPFGTISYCSVPVYCQVSTKIMQPIGWASIFYTVQKGKVKHSIIMYVIIIQKEQYYIEYLIEI